MASSSTFVKPYRGGIYLAHALDHRGLGQIGTAFANLTLHTCEVAYMQEPESNLSVKSRIPYWLYAWLMYYSCPCNVAIMSILLCVLSEPCNSVYIQS